jgi:hypothetical protein
LEGISVIVEESPPSCVDRLPLVAAGRHHVDATSLGLPGVGQFIGHLWNTKFKLSPQFIASDSFPCSPDDVVQLSAWGDSMAINVKGAMVLFKRGSDPLRTFSVPQTKSVACLPGTVV